MASIRCPDCSTQLSGSDRVCPRCNLPISDLRRLSAAILTKNAHMVAGLIQLGADVNAIDQNERTPLMIAASIASDEIVQMLLAAGAKPEFINTAGETALSVAKSREVERIIRRAIVVNRFTSIQKSAPPAASPLTSSVQTGMSKDSQPPHKAVKEQQIVPKSEPVVSDQQPVEVQQPFENFSNQEFKRTKGPRYFVPAMISLCLVILLLVLTWPQSSKSLVAHATRNLKPVNQMIKTQPEKHQPVQGDKIAVDEQPEEVDQIPETQVRNMTHTLLSRQNSRAAISRSSMVEDEAKIRLGRALNSQGFSLIKVGRPGEAIPVLEKSLRSFPKGTKDVYYAYAMFNLGVAWRKAGRPDLAIPILEERIKINNQRDVVAKELNMARQEAKAAGFDTPSRLNTENY
jgi:hypothetical protein